MANTMEQLKSVSGTPVSTVNMRPLPTETPSTQAVSTENPAAKPVFDVVSHLTDEQQIALEKKFSALPKGIPQLIRAAYPLITNTLHLYILKQLSEEADAAIVSAKRAGWISTLLTHIPSLVSSVPHLRADSEKKLTNVRDEIADTKVATAILKAVKKEMLSGISSERVSAVLKQLEAACPYFEVSITAL